MENSFLDNSWNKKEIKSETGECLRNADNKALHSRIGGLKVKQSWKEIWFVLITRNKCLIQKIRKWTTKETQEESKKKKNTKPKVG